MAQALHARAPLLSSGAARRTLLRTRLSAGGAAPDLRQRALLQSRRRGCLRRHAAHLAPCSAAGTGAVLPLLLRPALDALPVPPLALAACVLCGAALAAVWAGAASRARAQRPRVVIVGGGFAGLQAALELQHWAREVTMIDRASYFEFTPGVLAGLACGDARPCHRPHSRSLTARAKLLHVSQNTTLRVGDHELELSGEQATAQTVPFDFLILATGSSYPAPIKPTGNESVWPQHACTACALRWLTFSRRRMPRSAQATLQSRLLSSLPHATCSSSAAAWWA